MHAEVVTTGSELLLGQLVDTNSAFIARAARRRTEPVLQDDRGRQ
jgi:molybdopterin-biosynthesis enzyme MoeA-like protein